jgi:hypothetical protein
VAWLPLQAPEAVQDVASVEFQVSVDELPALTLVGVALKLTVGAGVGTGVGPKKEVTSR